MADSAARIAEIRQALTSTGKSVSAYSQKFAAGEAPEQEQSQRLHGEVDATLLHDDAIQSFLDNLTTVAKDLSGRSSGRNADDVHKITDGLMRLGATWSSGREAVERQALEAAMSELKSAQGASVDVEQQLKDAVQRAAVAESSLATAQKKTAALEQARATAVREAEDAATRAAAAEEAVADLQQKLRDAEASLSAVHSMDAAATVEEATPASPAKQTTTDAALTSALSISGTPVLGGTLRVAGATSLPNATFQWLRVHKTGLQDAIGGATRQQYAPEPRDVGVVLACAITPSPGEPVQLVSMQAPLSDMDGLPAAVSALAAKESAEFNCVVVQRNGEMQDRREVHQLEVLGDRVKLKRSGKTRFKEAFGDGMQVCGARGGGDAAAQGLFLALSPSLVFMLACESAKQRNAAILLIRNRAKERGFQVLGPKDKVEPASK